MKPRARTADLLVQDVEAEVVVYDLLTHRVHALSPLTARVFRACNGRRNVAALAREAGATEEVVGLALADLARVGLVDRAPRDPGPRRRVLRGLKYAAVPLIATIAAPTALQAATCAVGGVIVPALCGGQGTIGCCCVNNKTCMPGGTCDGPGCG